MSKTLVSTSDLIEQVLFEVRPDVSFGDEAVIDGFASEMEALVPDLHERVDVCRRLLMHLAKELAMEGE